MQGNLDTMRMDVDKYRAMLQNYNGKLLLDGNAIKNLPSRTTYHVKQYLKRVELTDTQKYAMGLIDAMHPLTEGVRVPSLLPVSTGTQSLFTRKTFSDSSQKLCLFNLASTA